MGDAVIGPSRHICVAIYSSEEMTLTYYIGLDVSAENTAIRVIDATGPLEKEFLNPAILMISQHRSILFLRR